MNDQKGKEIHRAELALGITSLGSPIKQDKNCLFYKQLESTAPIPGDEWDGPDLFFKHSF